MPFVFGCFWMLMQAESSLILVMAESAELPNEKDVNER